MRLRKRWGRAERHAGCARRSPAEATEDAGSIPATSTPFVGEPCLPSAQAGLTHVCWGAEPPIPPTVLPPCKPGRCGYTVRVRGFAPYLPRCYLVANQHGAVWGASPHNPLRSGAVGWGEPAYLRRWELLAGRVGGVGWTGEDTGGLGTGVRAPACWAPVEGCGRYDLGGGSPPCGSWERGPRDQHEVAGPSARWALALGWGAWLWRLLGRGRRG